MIVRQLREAGQIVEDPEINEYLQALGMRLSSQAHEGAHRFTFFAVRDTSINAFALPGGFIGVNAGLVTATRSEAELAGVLAHEIAHVTQRHIARSLQNAGRANIASMAADARRDPDRRDHRPAERRGAWRRHRRAGTRGPEPDQFHARQRGRG